MPLNLKKKNKNNVDIHFDISSEASMKDIIKN